jgi:sulfoxide reductase heme-binding subunit YedZ
MTSNAKIRLAKSAIFILSLLPFAWLVYGAFADVLGTNPVETLTHESGLWALRFLLITLVITPLRKFTGIHQLIRFRRMLGLFAFFYAVLHFMTYIWLDQFFDWDEILHDIPKRPFITVGFIAFVLLVPLAVTSTKSMQRRLKKNWQRLHQLVYIIPLLALLHFMWSLKADYSEPLFYTLIYLVLMVLRLQRKKTTIARKHA